MIEKKELQNQVVRFSVNRVPHQIEMKELIQIVERKNELEKNFINKTIYHMELLNRDIMEFLVFIAKNHYLQEKIVKTIKKRGEEDDLKVIGRH